MENSAIIDGAALSIPDSNPLGSATLIENELKKQLKAQKREDEPNVAENNPNQLAYSDMHTISIDQRTGILTKISNKEVLLTAAIKTQFEPSAQCDCPSLLPENYSSFRIVVVGDIHEEWNLEHDSKALRFLQPDMVLFTGDFGNENVELVKAIATLNFPKAAILGNHDSWSTSKFKTNVKDGVQLQLDCLGEAHVGYGHLDFPSLRFSVVGGRPFSCGGNQIFRDKLIKSNRYYKVNDMKESATKIFEAALQTPKENSIIFLSHNGPTGLGSGKDDICGKDWVTEGGDFGDPGEITRAIINTDLGEAISQLKKTTNYSIPLVVFGHMHKEMACGGSRKMVAVDADNTMYLNAAIVPRVKYPSSGGSIRVFTVVQFSDGKVTKVAESWVSILDDKASLEEEHILFSN